MKLLCPHCGVKGRAEDSYSGRRVKCPKCQGLFRAQAERAFPLPEDAPPVSALSSAPVEAAVHVDEIEPALATLDGHLGMAGEVTAAEAETIAVTAPEETLDWADIASDIDWQLTGVDAEAEEEELPEIAPAELSAIEDEAAAPAVDLGFIEAAVRERAEESEQELWTEESAEAEEIEEPDRPEEAPPAVSPDAESPVLALDGEPVDEPAETGGSTEGHGQGGLEVEDRQAAQAEEIELEPYGISKEQCWQCGRSDNLGEPFIAKDGRLYCAHCVPAEQAEQAVDTMPAQGAHVAPPATGPEVKSSGPREYTGAQFSQKLLIGAAIRTAWDKTRGAKASIWAGTAIMYLVLLALVVGGALLLPAPGGDLLDFTNLSTTLPFQAVTNVFSALFCAGLFLMGIRKVAGDKISWKMVFKGFSCAGKIIVAAILQFLLISLGFCLLVLPGIYLTVGYAMTLPLIVDQGLSPWQAMERSRKAVHRVWWRMVGLFLVMGLIFLGSLPLGIGIIWTWPMFIILVGVVYRQLFGDDKKTV